MSWYDWSRIDCELAALQMDVMIVEWRLPEGVAKDWKIGWGGVVERFIIMMVRNWESFFVSGEEF